MKATPAASARAKAPKAPATLNGTTVRARDYEKEKADIMKGLEPLSRPVTREEMIEQLEHDMESTLESEFRHCHDEPGFIDVETASRIRIYQAAIRIVKGFTMAKRERLTEGEFVDDVALIEPLYPLAGYCGVDLQTYYKVLMGRAVIAGLGTRGGRCPDPQVSDPEFQWALATEAKLVRHIEQGFDDDEP